MKISLPTLYIFLQVLLYVCFINYFEYVCYKLFDVEKLINFYLKIII